MKDFSKSESGAFFCHWHIIYVEAVLESILKYIPLPLRQNSFPESCIDSYFFMVESAIWIYAQWLFNTNLYDLAFFILLDSKITEIVLWYHSLCKSMNCIKLLPKR